MRRAGSETFRSPEPLPPAEAGTSPAPLRTGWIAVTYVTRPMVWAVVGAAIFAWVMDLLVGQIEPRSTAAYPSPPQPQLAVSSKKTLEEVRAAGRESKVDSIGLSSLWFSMRHKEEDQRPNRAPPAALQEVLKNSPPEDYYRVLDEFPNLRQVEYTCFGEPIGFERVAQLADVEYLTLYGCKLDLLRLRSWRKLRELILYNSAPPDHVSALASLPDLETIEFHSRMAITDELLVELAALPHLKVLVLDFGYFFPFEPRLTRAGFGALARSPSLETVFIGGRRELGDELITLARQALPNLNIKPAIHQSKVWGRDYFHVFPFALLALAIGGQLSSQFRSPLRRLAPSFAPSHALIAIMSALVVIGLCTVRLKTSGAAWNPALAVSAAIVASYIAWMATASIGNLSPVQLQGVGRSPQLLSLVPIGLTIALFIPDRADGILHDGDVWVLATLWLATIASLGLAACVLSRLAYWSAGVDILSTKNVREQFLVGGRYRENWLFGGHDREEQIEVWSRRAPEDWSWWRRIERWQFGNPPLRVARITLFTVALIVGVQAGVRWNSVPSRVSLSESLCFAGFMTLGMVAMQVGRMWRTRLSVLPLEITRTCTRRAMSFEWIAAFIVDLLPGVAIASAVAAIGLNWELPSRGDWKAVPGDLAILLPVALIMTVALGALFVVVERLWLAIVLSSVFIGLMPMAVLGTAFLVGVGRDEHGVPDVTPHAIEAQIWVAALIGAVLAWFLGHRFLTMEIGRRV
jgi:hypothetical protein